MRKRSVFTILMGFLLVLFGTNAHPAFAKAIYGKVTEIRSAEIVVLDHGAGQYIVRLVGVVAPKEGTAAQEAKQFVSNLLSGKNARLSFEYRSPEGEMVARVFVGDPGQDVGLELVRAGLAKRQQGYDYKYGELSAAENEAKKARRGTWK